MVDEPDLKDVWLKIVGTKKQAQQALIDMGLAKYLIKTDEKGVKSLVSRNKHVMVKLVNDLVTAYAVLDAQGNEITPEVRAGPHLWIRFSTKASRRKARELIIDAGGLPAALQLVPNPGTMVYL